MKKITMLFAFLVVLSACGQNVSSDAELADTAVIETNQKYTITAKESEPLHEDLTITAISKWNGEYSAYFNYGEIGGVNAGWSLTINVTPDSVTAVGEGYQMYFKDRLKPIDKQNQLELQHQQHVFGYELGKKMMPEFTITEKDGKFYVKSDWIGEDVQDKRTALGYLIERK